MGSRQTREPSAAKVGGSFLFGKDALLDTRFDGAVVDHLHKVLFPSLTRPWKRFVSFDGWDDFDIVKVFAHADTPYAVQRRELLMLTTIFVRPSGRGHARLHIHLPMDAAGYSCNPVSKMSSTYGHNELMVMVERSFSTLERILDQLEPQDPVATLRARIVRRVRYRL